MHQTAIAVNPNWHSKDQTKMLPALGRLLVQLMHPTPHQHVLDVACGPAGTCARAFSEAGSCVMAIDIKLKVIQQLKQKLADVTVYPQVLSSTGIIPEAGSTGDISLVVAHAEQLPFQDHQFDIITGVGALSNFDNPALALKEMLRILTPAGRIGLGDFMIPGIAHEVYGVLSTFRYGRRRPHLDYYQVQDLLHTVGLRVTSYVPLTWLSPLARSDRTAVSQGTPSGLYTEALLSVDMATRQALGIHQREGAWYMTNHSFALVAERATVLQEDNTVIIDELPSPIEAVAP